MPFVIAWLSTHESSLKVSFLTSGISLIASNPYRTDNDLMLDCMHSLDYLVICYSDTKFPVHIKESVYNKN